VFLDIALVAWMVTQILGVSLNIYLVVSVPVAFFVITGGALLSKTVTGRGYDAKKYGFRQSFALFGEKKQDPKEEEEKKKKRSLLRSKKQKKIGPAADAVQLELGMHNCPVHGPEKCAGNYLNLHSCNGPSSGSSKQLFWEEVPRPKPKVLSAAASKS
jgi:hypothetical protein